MQIAESKDKTYALTDITKEELAILWHYFNKAASKSLLDYLDEDSYGIEPMDEDFHITLQSVLNHTPAGFSKIISGFWKTIDHHFPWKNQT